MLEVIDLHFDYPDKHVLKGVQFAVPAGGLMHLRGSNGAGKTTLLKLLAGMLRPTKGDIRYDRQSIYEDITGYQQTICYIGHKTGVSQLLTVRENCHFDLRRDHTGLPFKELIHSFALGGLEEVTCGVLSVGQRRRVGLLRLLMSNAHIWLLDEPLVALDHQAVTTLMISLQKHLANGGLVVLSSHQNLPLGTDNYQEYLL
jgi:heme exporter protein A